MTVIAFDGKTLASDSRITADDRIDGEVKKLYPLPKGNPLQADYFAGAGSWSRIHSVLAWLNGKGSKPKSLHGASVLIIKKGKPYLLNKEMGLYPIPAPCSIGTGSDYAMAAMASGFSAIVAVKTAIKCNIFCGGKVQSVIV